MKLTVEQVAKMTKLSTATVRLYASRKKLGTKEGNRRYFSKQDVEAISGTSSTASKKSKAASKGTAKPAKRGRPAGKKAAAKKPVAKQAARKSLPKAAAAPVAAKPEPRVEKRSFWALFRRPPKQKVALLDAKIKK